MTIHRIYTGDDQRSHVEELSLASHPQLLARRPATAVFFKEFPVGTDLDWHPAPRRMLVTLVSGQLEMDVGDGTIRRYGPGDVRLIEDVTGRGHITRVLGGEPVVAVVVPLGD